VLIRRRPPGGLLGGMWELPGTPWQPAPWGEAALAHAPVAGLPWRAVPGVARHGFTHRALTLAVWAAAAPAGLPGEWRERAATRAVLPTAIRKALDLVG
jgi:A/G-specific adenine glycosylase